MLLRKAMYHSNDVLVYGIIHIVCESDSGSECVYVGRWGYVGRLDDYGVRM
jgi:hypothetical protein